MGRALRRLPLQTAFLLCVAAMPVAHAMESCPQRSAYFGDLHVHSRYSLDAYVLLTRLDPEDSYRFAKGHEVGIAGPGNTTQRVKLRQPLDFAAVTDHAEWLSHTLVLTRPQHPDHDGPVQTEMRNERGDEDQAIGVLKKYIHNLWEETDNQQRRAEWTQALPLTRDLWKEIQETANRHYEPGKFTTFIAFEWTGAPRGYMEHRNVIFRDRRVPDTPASAYSEETPDRLWDYLETAAGKGMAALAIPHNSNWSNGLMFSVGWWDGRPADASWARRRAEHEPIVEIFQIKGASETNVAYATEDEFAAFEVFTDYAYPGKPQRLSYAREGMKEGLRQQQELGINPFKFGLIASTDTHNGPPGNASETEHKGQHGFNDYSARHRLEGLNETLYPNVIDNPGGLAAVWAEANTREGIFDSLRRRETFGTSGPRIHLRYFAGWSFSEDDLKARDIACEGYAGGVPMGSDLPARPDGAAPTFLLSAAAAPGGANLDRIQIIKGWYGDRTLHERIYDVALSDARRLDARSRKVAPVGNTVDPDTAQYSNDIGVPMLQAVWRDPDFDPDEPAFYYARVLEIPTPRWSTVDAARLHVPPPAPATIQERAWGSPVWYTPPGASQRNEARSVPASAGRATGRATYLFD